MIGVLGRVCMMDQLIAIKEASHTRRVQSIGLNRMGGQSG
jgi:hypothetical protein